MCQLCYIVSPSLFPTNLLPSKHHLLVLFALSDNVVMLCYDMLCYIWYCYSGRSVHYVAPTMQIYTRAIANVIIAEGQLGFKQLAQGYICSPGNDPSRGPWALLSEFHLINVPNISTT